MSTDSQRAPQAPDGKYLPPIEQIVIPKTQTKSAKIRWLIAMGYKVAEISNYFGWRYQMVRNIATSEPKRAAREDLPPLVVEYHPEIDDVQAIMDKALEDSLKAERKAQVAQAAKAKSDEGGWDE